MIKFKKLTPKDISDEWLKHSLHRGLKECLTAPIMSLDNKPEIVRRTEMILENFSREDCPAVPTVISPGNMIQFIMPRDELLITILFLRERIDTRVQVVLQKLYYEEDGQL